MTAIRSFALLAVVGGVLSGCAVAQRAVAPPETPPPTSAQKEREERIVRTPWFVSSEYFREQRGEQQPVLDLPQLRRSREEQEAKQKTIEERLTNLETGKVGGEVPTSLGYVVKVSGPRIYTDLTAREGVAPGVVLSILSERDLTHPVSGRALGRTMEEIGRATVIEVSENFSVAEVVDLRPGETIQLKDRLVIRRP